MLGLLQYIIDSLCHPVSLSLSLSFFCLSLLMADTLYWNFKTICGCFDPSRNRVVVPARQTT